MFLKNVILWSCFYDKCSRTKRRPLWWVMVLRCIHHTCECSWNWQQAKRTAEIKTPLKYHSEVISVCGGWFWSSRYMNLFACWAIDGNCGNQKGQVVFFILRSYCCWKRLPRTLTSANETEKKNAMASLKKLKGILGKMRAEEETLRKGTPTVNFL